MLNFLIGFGSIALIALCGWLLLIILMQMPSANAGMGAALGGGAAESALGGEVSHVLTRWTVYGIIAFFALTLLLTLGQLRRHYNKNPEGSLTPMSVVEEKQQTSLTELPKADTTEVPSKA